jgi:membrane-associated phospholipid phosphatase
MDIIKNTIIKSVDIIGYLGPQLLFFASIYFLFKRNFTYLSVYFVGFFLNILLNTILKSLIQEPRPTEDKRLFNLELLNGKRIGYDRYGMPSGHAEGVFYSTAFIFLTLKNKWIGFIYLVISLITCYQRVAYKNHTFQQVLIGGIVGAFMGFFFYYYGVHILKGKLREKPDDNAPYY